MALGCGFADRFAALPGSEKPALVAALGERFDVLFDEDREQFGLPEPVRKMLMQVKPSVVVR